MTTRRRFLSAAATTGALSLTGCQKHSLPPTYGSLFGLSDALSFAAQRWLLRRQPLAREFRRDQISARFPAINTTNPPDREYQQQRAGHFADWRLSVDGLVASPGELSLADLKAFPSRSQVTLHCCEQGWSAIAEWTGVQLSTLLQAVGTKPEARYVVFYSVDDWWDSLDMFDALHPQTLLAYGMNGGELPVQHGAPLRLRVERQLGYKQLKYVGGIEVTDRLDNVRDGTGAVGVALGYPWYAGI